jgi:hypothetical protein
LLDKWIKANKMNKTTGTKKVRDPLAHYQSQGVQGWRNDHSWEATLFRNDKIDFIESYDKNYLENKSIYLGNIRNWIPKHQEVLSIIFTRLCSFSLDKLELM